MILEVDVLEVTAVLKGLEIAWEIGIRDVLLKGDCSSLVQALVNKLEIRSSFGSIVDDFIINVKRFNSCSFMHVCREGNSVAHVLAKFSGSCNELIVWMEEVPTVCTSLINDDLASF